MIATRVKRLFPVLLLALLLFGSWQNCAWAASTPPEKTASGSPGENPNKHATFNPVLTIQLQRDAAMWGEGTVLDVDVGPNLYAYVRQNPWTAFDPHGLYHEVYKSKPNKDGVVHVRIVIPIAYKNSPGSKKTFTPEDTARFNKRISETYSGEYTEGGGLFKKGTKYKVTAEVKQITNDTFENEGSDHTSDEFLTDGQHADKYRYNIVTFQDKEGDGGHWENEHQTLRNQGTVGPLGDANALTHEIGHAMDLKDNGAKTNVMYSGAGKTVNNVSPGQLKTIVNKQWTTEIGDAPGRPAPAGATPIIDNADPKSYYERRKKIFENIRSQGKKPFPRTRNYIDEKKK